jgi:hypothetical protein
MATEPTLIINMNYELVLELIRKENLKGTQLIARSKFQRISAVLT